MYTIGILHVHVVKQFIVKVPRTSQKGPFLKVLSFSIEMSIEMNENVSS